MSPQNVARAAAVTGWLAGMVLILAGWALLPALAVPAGTWAAAAAAARWGAGLWTGFRLAAKLRRAARIGASR